MDCPAEENLVRVKLDGFAAVKALDFDLPNRQLTVSHDGMIGEIESAISDLGLGMERLSTEQSAEVEIKERKGQRNLLWIVLSINFGFFVIEMTAGWISGSMGLVADSLDMLADSFVYAISLFAVGAAVARKKRIATISGYFQIALALTGFVEVVRRFIGIEALPDSATMIGVSVLAMAANMYCLFLFHKSNSPDAHMQASAIFTSNDVVINFGVIAAGALVYFFESSMPDLIIGTIVFVVVLRGAFKILRLGR